MDIPYTPTSIFLPNDYQWKDLIDDLLHKDYIDMHIPHHKSTQTDTTDTTEFLLGKLVLEHCPHPELVINYVKHANTSAALLQSLTHDKTPGPPSRNVPSRSNE